MGIEYVVSNILIPSMMYGILIGGSIFLFGLGIQVCFKLFNS